MDGEGMVAVVRGLRGSGLAVTLLDSGRQFTLLPENNSKQSGQCSISGHTHPAPATNIRQTTASQCVNNVARRESSVQATDGRYTSTYKLMHCHSTPTSPPEQVTEFPPQRADTTYPGHGNFIVGGQGSGENYCYPMKSNEFRGAMCWPDRGSVCSPRPSLQPDSFATSLRKYPNICQDRSSEIVERLINFTQTKNSYRDNRYASPSRNLDTKLSNQTFCVNAKSRITGGERSKRGYLPEVTIRPTRFEESREVFKQDPYDGRAKETWRKPTYCKTNDVRYLRDVSRNVRDGIRSLSAQANDRPERLNPRERSNSSNEHRRGQQQWSTETVNMEIQAAVQMITREIMTTPRIAPSQRTVAVPLTPTLSETKQSLDERNEDTDNVCEEQLLNPRAQFMETKLRLVDTNVQTLSNNVEFSFHKKHKRRDRIRSRSEEKLQIIELMKYRNAGVAKQNALKSRSYRKFHSKSKPSEIFVEFIKNFENQIFHVGIPGKRECAVDKYRQSFAKIFYSSPTDSKIHYEDDLNKILEAWMKLVPLKLKDKFDIEKEKKYIQYDLFNYLKRIATVPPEQIRKEKLKADILDRLKLIHLDVKRNKAATLNSLAEILIHKVTCVGRRRWDIDGNRKGRDVNHSLLKSLQTPTEKDVEAFVLKYTTLFLQRFGLKLQKSLIKEIQDELLDIFITSMEAITNGNIEFVKTDIVQFLRKYGLSEQKSYNFANILIKYFKETFTNDTIHHKVRSETLIVLPNVCSKRSVATVPDLTIENSTNDDIATNLKHFTNKICQHINEWLSDLEIPQAQDKESRQALINELAEEIVERRKYLELNPYHKVSDEAELELFKYQVFKWIKKLTVQDSLEAVEHVHDFMKRIKNIPVTMISRLQDDYIFSKQLNDTKIIPDKSVELNIVPQKNIVSIATTCNIDQNALQNYEDFSKIKSIIGSTYAPYYKKEGNAQIINIALNNNEQKTNKNHEVKPTPQCSHNLKNTTCEQSCPNQNKVLSSSVDIKNNDQLEAEYDQFIKDWVQEIPMAATNQKEEVILEKARLGIYNGLWKVISKLNCDPSTYYNQFLYEDLLDDAIDDLLDCLPQSSDLKSKRHLLKVRLIEKTISTNNQIKENEEASYKNKLIQNVVINLRKQGITDHRDGNPTELHEHMQITKLVESYLLLTKFKNEDKVISNVYRKKLIKEVKDFVNDLVKNHAKELKDIDLDSYENDIVNLLNKVPLPSENTIKQEADDVLLGIEIEQWYGDLPIVSNNDYTEQYQRRKQRDNLAKKIKEIENKNDMDSSEMELRNEVSRFLEKAPLEEGESLNINFMVDELLNRLKNKTKYDKSHSAKSPCCSSFTKLPKSPRVVIKEPPSYRLFEEERPSSSSFKETSNKQWHTLQKTVPDVGTQTENKTMHTLPPYIDPSYTPPITETHIEAMDGNVAAGTSESYHEPHYFIPREIQATRHDGRTYGKELNADPGVNEDNHENMYINNFPTTSQSLKGTSPYRQRNGYISYPRDIFTEEMKNQTTNDEEDQFLLKSSKVSQTDNKTKNVATEPDTVDNKTMESLFRRAKNSNTAQVPNDRRVPKLEKDAQRQRFTYDSDEEDKIPCNCIERYLKHRQKMQNYPCEDFDRLPSCLPIFYPYPYFML
ncbi:uncharacterized protein LOC125074153 isoform X1 [Vanessa atalanta]|uniref:uncharacterized protein LOC125074153 isoform X1 n=1 Tax=Vanessa atalanta TaxID=42275 RepID=UPI001FCE1EA1|nr:uncharacterized protein LOC125074153 isoform X1 [Vanessa atalanta]